jgi:acetylornithine deacetylase/succinyl-diaminopimelate desuccinylase-like protein
LTARELGRASATTSNSSVRTRASWTAYGVRLTGTGTVADRLWSRPAVTVLGIDCPPVVGSAAAVPATARARVSLRVPPGTDPGAAREALTKHLTDAAPWGAKVTVETEGAGSPFRAATDGPAYTALGTAMEEVYGKPLAFLGQGGSIPLCNVLAETYPRAEITSWASRNPAASSTPRTRASTRGRSSTWRT